MEQKLTSLFERQRAQNHAAAGRGGELEPTPRQRRRASRPNEPASNVAPRRRGRARSRTPLTNLTRAKLGKDVKKSESDSETEEIKEAETSDVEGEKPVIMTCAEHVQKNWERRERAKKEFGPEIAWASVSELEQLDPEVRKEADNRTPERREREKDPVEEHKDVVLAPPACITVEELARQTGIELNEWSRKHFEEMQGNLEVVSLMRGDEPEPAEPKGDESEPSDQEMEVARLIRGDEPEPAEPEDPAQTPCKKAKRSGSFQRTPSFQSPSSSVATPPPREPFRSLVRKGLSPASIQKSIRERKEAELGIKEARAQVGQMLKEAIANTPAGGFLDPDFAEWKKRASKRGRPTDGDGPKRGKAGGSNTNRRAPGEEVLRRDPTAYEKIAMVLGGGF